jgi:hypothetical protein
MHFSEATSQKLKLAIFAFSIRQGKCIEYVYGGCFGTKNLFNSKSACDDACPLKEEYVLCKLPPVTPALYTCLARIPMWTYDSRLVFVDFFKGAPALEAMTRCTLYNIFYEENAFF